MESYHGGYGNYEDTAWKDGAGVNEHGDGKRGLRARWSAIYHREWDEMPEAYVTHELVGWGRSRRLARFDDTAAGFKAYVGVQHYDPSRWNAPGEARAKFFLSLFLGSRTVTLRTFPTLTAALAELETFYSRLSP